MNDAASFSMALIAGMALGGFFFGGLWWTVQKGLTSTCPVRWFFGSSLLRTGAVVAGFFFVARGDWRRLLVVLIGFVIARLVVTRLTRVEKENVHAS